MALYIARSITCDWAVAFSDITGSFLTRWGSDLPLLKVTNTKWVSSVRGSSSALDVPSTVHMDQDLVLGFHSQNDCFIILTSFLLLSWKAHLPSQKNIFEPRKIHFLWSHPEFQTVPHYRATHSHLHRDNLSTASSVGRQIILGNFFLLCHFMILHKGIIVPQQDQGQYHRQLLVKRKINPCW